MYTFRRRHDLPCRCRLHTGAAPATPHTLGILAPLPRLSPTHHFTIPRPPSPSPRHYLCLSTRMPWLSALSRYPWSPHRLNYVILIPGFHRHMCTVQTRRATHQPNEYLDLQRLVVLPSPQDRENRHPADSIPTAGPSTVKSRKPWRRMTIRGPHHRYRVRDSHLLRSTAHHPTRHESRRDNSTGGCAAGRGWESDAVEAASVSGWARGRARRCRMASSRELGCSIEW
ncbi:hypothetical protein BZA05DRAFT_209328 [Tricharina praecox]|uniref:uncharacterized protein n=1 Tax=Tricharina praecox TaxID=43433 RepID=UPI00221F5D12|nr:uncharacterized protein BZA05DRAFT_209328 [Tricharina praecox]KAI5841996.1 hypothetical protein BZA05DRAFT_209328 [Tricharina praecox]